LPAGEVNGGRLLLLVQIDVWENIEGKNVNGTVEHERG